VKIDPLIVGGFIAATDKYLIDASIKGQLKQLGKNF
jgi:F0F1-type ATP synthase delta subunit